MRALLAFASVLLLAAAAARVPERPALRIGTGDHVYDWDTEWPVLPEGMELGNTHGCIVTDKAGRVFFNTDSEHAVVVIGADGVFEKSWGAELAGGLHGMCLVEEDGEEFLYLTHIERRALAKATLDGEILWSVGYPLASGMYYDPSNYRPTSVAVAPGGEIFVADGYGKSWVHEYAVDAGVPKWVRSFGGPGDEPGKMNCPHGLWLDDSGDEPRLVVSDRENHRLQLFDLEGRYLGLADTDLRRPCHSHRFQDATAVADLAGRVTLLDADLEVITHLGENPHEEQWARNDVGRELWTAGYFIAPHCARWDAEGNLYVMDWVSQGRVTKLRRVR